MSIDHHETPYDEGTCTKLKLYEDYLTEWLPVWIESKINKQINILDLFAGPGSDSQGTPGSPLRALGVIEKFREKLICKGKAVHLYLNELNPQKFNTLELKTRSFRDKLPIELHLTCKDFSESLENIIKSPSIKYGANLIFLDQNGVKQVPPPLFNDLLKVGKSDVLFFISSSYFNRFIDTPEFANYFPDLRKHFEEKKINQCHRVIADYYTEKAPGIYVGQFTIKKNTNIYGLIFGCVHPLGAYKFVNVCWKAYGGDANFDIDDDGPPEQLSLFDDNKPKKLEVFQRELEDKLNRRQLKTNKDIYIFSLRRGIPPSETKKLLIERIPKLKLDRDCFKRDPVPFLLKD